jgi:hypothetical protein
VAWGVGMGSAKTFDPDPSAHALVASKCEREFWVRGLKAESQRMSQKPESTPPLPLPAGCPAIASSPVRPLRSVGPRCGPCSKLRQGGGIILTQPTGTNKTSVVQRLALEGK